MMQNNQRNHRVSHMFASIMVILTMMLALSWNGYAQAQTESVATPDKSGQTWLTKFNESCAKTLEAMDCSVEELQLLINDCERVKKSIALQDEATRKVNLRRVQSSLDLFRFVLESKNNNGKVTAPVVPVEK